MQALWTDPALSPFSEDRAWSAMAAATNLTPAELALRAQLAAHTRWANATSDERAENGKRAQRGLLDRFAREVDPDGILPPDERERRATNARKAHMARLALKSSQSRRAKAAKAKKGGGADAAAA